MRWLWNAKDGGPYSKVWAWGLEIKSLFSVLVLKFCEGSREAYHSHAFNCVSWLLSGELEEHQQRKHENGVLHSIIKHVPRLRPILTYRDTLHKVYGIGTATWVLTFRGPWADTWVEITDDGEMTLTHGRRQA